MTVDYFSYSGLFVTHLVFPDGRTRMNLIGGAGAEAVAGMRIWSDSVGLVAYVASDFPAAYRRFLADECRVDLTGLVAAPYERLQMWLLYDDDQSRVEVMRGLQDWARTQVPVSRVPVDYHRARGVHTGGPDQEQLAFLRRLKADHGTALCVESLDRLWNGRDTMPPPDLLAGVDIFSPDLAYAARLARVADPVACLDALQPVGADVLALRMGGRGSLVRDCHTGETWHVPVVPTDVVDVTGAGNAYSGGYLIGWAETGDPVRAGCYGAVSASFLIEQFGLPRLDTATRSVATARLEQLWRVVEPLPSRARGGS